MSVQVSENWVFAMASQTPYWFDLKRRLKKVLVRVREFRSEKVGRNFMIVRMISGETDFR